MYFPHLYPLLLRTLLELTEPDDLPMSDTFGPEVILSCKSWSNTELTADQPRSLALEESFFDALSLYFKLTPVTGAAWEAKMFICKRWRVTEEWALPDATEIMNGRKGILRGRVFGLVDQLLGSLEW